MHLIGFKNLSRCTVSWTSQYIYSKNKFEKLVHLVGFIIRIYRDARSREGHSIFIPKINVRN